MVAEIRRAHLADAESLNALWGEADALHHSALPEVFAPPIEPAGSRDAVIAILDDPDQALMVADAGGRLFGVIHVSARERHPPMVARRFAVVEAVVVAAQEQGAGIGRRLMAEARRWSADRAADEIWLDVWAFNERAIRCYEALGYETVSRRMRQRLDHES